MKLAGRSLEQNSAGTMVLLTAVFAIGAGLGTAFANTGVSIAWEQLELGRDVMRQSAGFGQALLLAARFPVFLFCCGFLRHGSILVFPAVGCRGFFLAYTTAALCGVYADAGYFLAFSLLFAHGFLLLPVIFYTAAYSCRRQAETHRRKVLAQKDAVLALILALIVLLAALIETTLTPIVTGWFMDLFGL